MPYRTSLAVTSFAALLLCSTAPAFAQGGARAPLPDGEGKALVEAVCTACHQTNMIQNSSGYTHAQWEELFGTMVDLSGRPEEATIATYLAENFPPSHNPRPAKQVDGDFELTFTEWQVPTLGQRSRDPIQAEDGSIWWNGQFGNIVGRLDPVTGEMKEWQLPPGSLPHSIEFDKNGLLWWTGNGNGTVGSLDPDSGEIKVYPMPDPAVRDPHTAIFNDDNTMFFTAQNSNFVGRLIPSTGEIVVKQMPHPDSKPYGIKLDSHGTPWVACNGYNCLVSIDPETMELTQHMLPGEGTMVRRLDIAADDTIWYVNSALGKLGHFDPKTGQAEEWDSPSGPGSHPYALAIVDGIVWYDESGVRPDMLVRFDPATEKFQSWPIPSGNIFAGIVRHMRATREGDLLIHQSSTNHIMRVNLHEGD